MKIQIDLKSAVCGLIVGVAAMFLMGADSSPSNEIGRYQISNGGIGAGANFYTVIDTKTGEVWATEAGTTGQSQAKHDNFWNEKNK